MYDDDHDVIILTISASQVEIVSPYTTGTGFKSRSLLKAAISRIDRHLPLPLFYF